MVTTAGDWQNETAVMQGAKAIFDAAAALNGAAGQYEFEAQVDACREFYCKLYEVARAHFFEHEFRDTLNDEQSRKCAVELLIEGDRVGDDVGKILAICARSFAFKAARIQPKG